MARRLAAILAADVVEFARLMGEDESRTLARLKALHKELVKPEITSRGGRVVKLMGDGLLAEFPSAIEAVLCAVGIQDALAEREAEQPADQRLALRIGVNLGDIIFEGADIFGDGVNVAARLEGLAAPGGICISGPVFETIDGKHDLEFKDIGLQQVKNITKPVRAFRWDTAARPSILARAGSASADKPSIAVLPFANLSGDPEQEHVSDGITEDIITELSRFSGLIVIARNSTFTYKNQAVRIPQAARDLGVRYVLEGSVRRGGNLLRITAQLLHGDDGSHVWGEKYDGELADVFALQDEITRKVVGAIAPQIELAEVERGRKLTGANLTAYELALKAQALFYDGVRTTSPETLDRAEVEVDGALALDPRNIHGLWTKSLITLYRYVFHWTEDPEAALAACDRVTESLIHIDSTNAKPYMVRAWSHMYRRRFDAALADHRRALALNPNLAANLFAMAWSEAIAGLAEDARAHTRLALRLSPRETDIWLGEGYSALALTSLYERDFAEAVRWGQLADQRQPAIQTILVSANGHLGDLAAARSHIDTLATFAPEFLSAVLSGKTEVCKRPEHNELLVEGLRRAVL